jgi:AMP nucleosidase
VPKSRFLSQEAARQPLPWALRFMLAASVIVPLLFLAGGAWYRRGQMLEQAVADITQTSGAELKAIMRTGTVASTDNRNWELLPDNTPQRRFSQSRAVALDMESATIAANGFRFRVPYGTLLCVSDKPLHGELKLPGMASEFYKTQVSRHLQIGIRAMEHLREMPLGQIHSRKLRSFDETAFL